MSLTTSSSKVDMAKTVISIVGSVAATAMVVRSIAHDYLPHEIRDFLSLRLHNMFNRFSTQMTIVIDEYDGLTKNEIYRAAAIHLATKTSPKTRRLKATKPKEENNISLAMERNEEVIESYNGVKFRWGWVCHQTQHADSRFSPYKMGESTGSESQYFLVTFHKKHQEMAVKSYLPYILHEAESKKQESKTLKIFTVERSRFSNMKNTWKSVVLDHPSTFDTLAMDSGVKEMVLKDLERFVKRKEKYRNVGKAWKRGYLLYGPPGTGKSSLIAAMANYLKFDIYDLELTEVTRNSDLRKLLISTANRSILVVEDIDCTIELQDRMTKSRASWQPVGFYVQEESKVTLSGFLNFIDGLWSSCGDERIIIFTTNHKEKLDPALLRPGRMDLHIHMSYCTPCGLKILADNYLGVNGGSHRLFGEIEELITTIEVTPAEVAEQLLKSDEPDVSFSGLLDFLHAKRRENEEDKAKKLNETNLVAKEKENGQDDDGFSEKTNGLTSESMK